MSKNSEREEFIAGLLDEYKHRTDVNPVEVYQAGISLLSLAKSYQRLQLISCNQGLSKREKAYEERLEALISKKVTTLPDTWVEFGGDPRGYTVRLHLPSGRSNSFGGDRIWGVPAKL